MVIATAEAKTRLFAGFVVVGLLVAVAFHLVMGQLGFSYPWTTFLFSSADRFNDWHNSLAAAATLDPYFATTKAISAYFPFAYLLMRIATGCPRMIATSIYLAVSSGLLVLAVLTSVRYLRDCSPQGSERRMSKVGLTLLLILACFAAYPVLFALDRGNLDIWIACLCTFYVACLRTRMAWFGLLSLAVAIALKGYPLAFLGLSVAERRYRDVALVPLVAVALTLASLASLQGGVLHNLQGFIAGLAKYREAYVLQGNSLFGSSDPYNALRTLKVFMGTPQTEIAAWSTPLIKVYGPLALLFALVAGLCASFVRMPYWRRVTIICLVAIMFPNVANDYKLTVLLPCLFAILFTADQQKESTTSTAMLLLIALLMIPKSYFFINGLSVNNVINALLLVTLAILALSGLRRTTAIT
jgi:hypothetical protein